MSISAVITFEDKRVSIHSSQTKTVGKYFNKGFYEARFDQNGNLIIQEEELGELHTPYKTEENKIIIDTIQGFFKEGVKEKVNKLGFTHKLGILMYGIAGTGKTSMMSYVSQKMIETKDAIVFFCNNSSTLNGAVSLAKKIREVQDNPIIFIADEFERYARDSESEMKGVLDGNDSIENSLFLATTNYIDRVPETLKNRPSRFRIVQEIFGIKDKKLMEDILITISNKIQPGLFQSKEIKEIIKDKDSCTLDELKHIALDKVTETFVKVEKKEKIGFSVKKEGGLSKDFIEETDNLFMWNFLTKEKQVNKESNIWKQKY